MDNLDYQLLKYLSQFDKDTTINQDKLPFELRTNYKDNGNINDSVFGHLHRLSQRNLVINRYAGMSMITDDGIKELKRYEQDNAGELYIERCDAVLRYLVENKIDDISAEELSQALNIEVARIERVGNELKENNLVELVDDSGIRFIVMPAAADFIDRTSFKNEREKKSAQQLNIHKLVHVPNNSGIYAEGSVSGSIGNIRDSSNAAAGNATQTVTTNPPPKEAEKKKWYEPILEDIRKRWLPYLATTLFGFVTGRVTEKSETPTSSQTQTQIAKPKNITDTTSNKSTISLDSVQKQ